MPRVYTIRVEVHFSGDYIERNSEGDPHAEVAETATREYQITADGSSAAIVEAVKCVIADSATAPDDIEKVIADVVDGLYADE